MNTVKSLLNQLCGTTEDVRRDIESQLKKHFIDPFYVSRSKSLPENDIMKVDARIVSDAFEAVTNGMYDEDILNELENLSDSSFFSNWKYLTESLYYLYAENFTKADEAFRKIEEDSIPHLTAPVFYRIISRDKISSISGLSDSEKIFINNIIKDSISVKSSLDQIETNLKTGHEDRFTDNITLLLSDLYVKDQNLSKKLASWGLRQISLNDMSPSMLLENLKLIFGESETYRLTAVSFREEDPELSLIFFSKSALIQLRNNSIDSNYTEAFIDILADLIIEIEKEKADEAELQADDEMTDQISNILTVLEREIQLHYPDILAGRTIREKASDRSDDKEIDCIKTEVEKTISIQPSAKNTDNKNPASSHIKKSEKSGSPVQLELFF